MPDALLETPASASPPRKIWTRGECEVLETLGLLEGQHYELVGGALISKMGKPRRHVAALAELADCLVQIFGRRFVNRNAPIDVAPEDNPTNEPEPNAIVLKRERSTFSRNPQPDELHLAVEVADSTLYFDLKTKAALYARAGITEYWVLDIQQKQMIVHRNPQDGRYLSIFAYAENEAVAPLGAPDSLFRVGDSFQE